MEKVIDFILCSGIVCIEILGVLAIALLIQGFTYQLSNKKINLYKILSYNLLEKWL